MVSSDANSRLAHLTSRYILYRSKKTPGLLRPQGRKGNVVLHNLKIHPHYHNVNGSYRKAMLCSDPDEHGATLNANLEQAARGEAALGGLQGFSRGVWQSRSIPKRRPSLVSPGFAWI